MLLDGIYFYKLRVDWTYIHEDDLMVRYKSCFLTLDGEALEGAYQSKGLLSGW